MKTPFGRMWSLLRGDKYMVDAYPAPVEPTATGPDAPAAVPTKEH